MDRELEAVIARLEARFDAALGVEEEEAAGDLARSLRQDRNLAELVRDGGGFRLLEGEGAVPEVTVIGADYCGSGRPLTCLRRLGSAPLVADPDGSAPEFRRDSLQAVARRWARSGCLVEVALETDSLGGHLSQVGPDNVVLEAVAGRVIVPLWLVRSIRRVREG